MNELRRPGRAAKKLVEHRTVVAGGDSTSRQPRLRTTEATCAKSCGGFRARRLSNTLVYRRYVVQPASVLIASAGIFWTIQRALF